MYRAIVLMPPEWLAKHDDCKSLSSLPQRPDHTWLAPPAWGRSEFSNHRSRHSQACLASIMNRFRWQHTMRWSIARAKRPARALHRVHDA